VGIGGYGRLLRPSILSAIDHGMCRLVAAADTRLAKLKDDTLKLEPYGPKLYDDAMEMLDDFAGKCQAVFLVTSIPSHEPLTTAAAKRGYHIWLEKPPSATIQETDRMIAAVEAAGVACQVAFRWVFSRDINFIKDRIVDGRLGKIKHVTNYAGWPRKADYYCRNPWAGNLTLNGKWVLDGPATNALAHQTNNLLYLASAEPGGYATPTSVRAELYAAGPVESHDTASIEVQTAQGVPLYFHVTHCSDRQFGPVIDVVGEKGKARWTFDTGPLVTYSDGRQERNGREVELGRDTMVAEFLRAGEAGDPSMVRCTLRHCRNYMLAANGMHESSGRIHRIADKFTRRVGEGTHQARTVIEGIDGMLAAAAEKRCLFSDLPGAPAWAVATEAVDVTDYTTFPRSFAC